MAFFCSNRYSNKGCGRTYSILCLSAIPNCTARCDELYEFLSLLVIRGVVALAWREACRERGFTLSKTSAYRWVRLFKDRTHHFRSTLAIQTHPPPPPVENWVASPNPEVVATMEMFDEATNQKTVDPFSAYQLRHQEAFY